MYDIDKLNKLCEEWGRPAKRKKHAAKMTRYYRNLKENDPIRYISDKMYSSAKTRAKAKGLEFNIELDDITIPKNCPVFPWIEITVGGDRDTSPSIDRIDNTLGYVKGNIRVVSYVANRKKTDMSFQEVKALYENWSKI